LDNIEGLKIYDLSIYNDKRGSLLHILSLKNHPDFKFGECYASETKPQVIKAWKRHKKIAQNLVVVSGEINLVIYDDRNHSSSINKYYAITLNRDNYKLVHIPKGLWYGFKCTSKSNAIIINCIDTPYDPSESEGCQIEKFPLSYEW
jgi:dTDP-4-dehydrorhamnose 3,5-epimerase